MSPKPESPDIAKWLQALLKKTPKAPGALIPPEEQPSVKSVKKKVEPDNAPGRSTSRAPSRKVLQAMPEDIQAVTAAMAKGQPLEGIIKNIPEDAPRLVGFLAEATRQIKDGVPVEKIVSALREAIRTGRVEAEEALMPQIKWAKEIGSPDLAFSFADGSSAGDVDIETKLPTFNFTNAKVALEPDLQAALEGIEYEFEADPVARGNKKFFTDKIKELHTFARKGGMYVEQVRPFIKNLQDQLSLIQESGQLAFGNREWLKVEAEATRYIQDIRNAHGQIANLYQKRPDAPPVDVVNEQTINRLSTPTQSSELDLLMTRALDDNSAIELTALQTSLNSLVNKTIPNVQDPESPIPVLTSEDRAIAGAVNELIAAKKGLATFREKYIGDLSRKDDEALKYFFRHLSYKDPQVDWIFTEMSMLSNPNKQGRGLLQELNMQPDQVRLNHQQLQKWQTFEKQVELHFNIMFEEVQANPSGAWEEWFTMFYHRPAYQTFMSRLGMLKSELFTTYGKMPDALQPHFEMNGKIITLRTLVDNLYEKMRASYDFQEYTHNAFYILTTRGDLKSLAGYANRLRSDMIDLVFSDEKVQAAYHYFEQILRHELGWSQWRVDATWFQFVKDPANGKWVEKITERVQRIMREQFPDTNEEWDIQRAMSIARGSLFGVTSVGLDLLGEADAPMAGDRWSGYFGERILYSWNPTRHFFYRWWPSKAERYMPLLYNKNYRSPTGRPWDPHKLDEWHDKHHSDRLTNLRNYKDGVLPFIQQSNWLEFGGSEARGGWRKRASIKNIFSRIPLLGDEYNTPDYEHFKQHHLDHTRGEFEKVGLNYLYYWAEMLDKAVKDGLLPLKMVQDARLTLGDVYLDVLKKDPLFFITRDSTLWDIEKLRPIDEKTREILPPKISFKDTIRGKALKKLGNEWDALVNPIIDPVGGAIGEGLDAATPRVAALRDRVDLIEEDLMKATELMVKHGHMSWTQEITDALGKVLPKDRVDIAKRYYDAVIDVVINEKTDMTWEGKKTGFMEVTERVTFFEEFQRRKIPYSIGTVTKNWDFVKEAGGGQGTQARALDDALKLADGVVAPYLYFNYDLDKIIKANGDFSKFDEKMESAREAMTYVHGQFGQYDRFSHDITELSLRNFQKAWWGRLPGIGSLNAMVIPGITALHKNKNVRMEKQRWAAFSQKIKGNPLLLSMDESMLYGRIRHLIDVNLLTPEQGALLMKEMGGTAVTALYDSARTYIPRIALIALITGLVLGRKDQKEEQ